MEILGRSIPSLQNAIASGLESVTAGIAESTKASGPVALGIAQQSFFFEQAGSSASADLPAVAGAGDYASPVQYFHAFQDSASQSPISGAEIQETLDSPRFHIDPSLFGFVSGAKSNIRDLIDQKNGISLDQIKTPELMYKEHNEAVAEAQEKKIKDKMNEMNQRVVGIDYRPPWVMASDVSAGGARSGGPLQEIVDQMNEAGGGAAGEMGLRGEKVSRPEWITVSDLSAGGASGAGGSSSNASDRSSMIAGGTSSDTYFQTIDDSLNQLQQNPTPQTFEMFTAQFGAVQDMISTAEQTVQMSQSIAAKIFAGIIPE